MWKPFCRNYVFNKMSLNDFEILSDIGKGSFGSVHKVRRKLDNCIYALKKVRLAKLNSKEKSNAINEVRLLASINHPNIVSYKESFYDGDKQILCIVMEFADNGDLEEKILNKIGCKQFFLETEIWSCLIQVLRGLKDLHSRKILHRDIKSANIFLNKEGVVKIGDMNVSKVLKETLKNTQTGTPFYASPEIWKNERYDFKSDMWSLGCLIYEMSSLKPPFTGFSMKGVYENVIRGNYDEIPAIYSKLLKKFISSMLQVLPSKRASSDALLSFIERRFSIHSFYNSAFLLNNSKFKTITVTSEEPHKLTLSTKNYLDELNSLQANDESPFQPTSTEEQNELSKMERSFSNFLNIESIDVLREVNEVSKDKGKPAIRKLNIISGGANSSNTGEKETSRMLSCKLKINPLIKTIHFPKRITDLNKILPKKKYTVMSRNIPQQSLRANSIAPISNKHSLALVNLVTSHQSVKEEGQIKINQEFSNSDVIQQGFEIPNIKRIKNTRIVSASNAEDKKSVEKLKLMESQPSNPLLLNVNYLDHHKHHQENAENGYMSSNNVSPILFKGKKIIVHNIINSNTNNNHYIINGSGDKQSKLTKLTVPKSRLRNHSSLINNCGINNLSSESAKQNEMKKLSISSSRDGEIERGASSNNNLCEDSQSRNNSSLMNDENSRAKETYSTNNPQLSNVNQLPSIQLTIQSSSNNYAQERIALSYNHHSRNAKGELPKMKTNIESSATNRNLITQKVNATNTYDNSINLNYPPIYGSKNPISELHQGIVSTPSYPRNQRIPDNIASISMKPKTALQSIQEKLKGHAPPLNIDTNLKAYQKPNLQRINQTNKLKSEMTLPKYKKRSINKAEGEI